MKPEISIIDDLSPEDGAMLQALYSRSAESHKKHLEKVEQTGSGKFMSSYYVGYNHKSIGDCGTTTVFIEYVSLLAAKAIQDWSLYSGQETSTRFMNMSTRPIVDPMNTTESKAILDSWMNFYNANKTRTYYAIKERYPIKDGESKVTYERAVQARVFDIMRGFLPAGITTQLSWHTNLRQALDHLILLHHHPAAEVRAVAKQLSESLHAKYPSSGFMDANPENIELDRRKLDRILWENYLAKEYSYQLKPDSSDRTFVESMLFWAIGALESIDLQDYHDIIGTRPRGCVLPHFLSNLGQCHWRFALDFGSFRDLQRHRNGVCPMPLLTTDLGFEPWYLDQLDKDSKEEALRLIDIQTKNINSITDDPITRQYYTALGFRVLTHVTYGLPAAVYVMELRSGKTVHPTLRNKVHQMIIAFQEEFPEIVLHVDLNPDDWDIRRGAQTITEK